MTPTLPALFLSHGPPDLILSSHSVVDEFKALSNTLGTPRAIVIVSAHWVNSPVGITACQAPETLHDFGGFAETLYQLRYPASGDPQLAGDIAALLNKAGIECELHPHRGLDHGAWMPLMLMYPAARIPVVQVSLPAASLQQCLDLGKALQVLRHEGVLIIGSGGSVHNLRALARDRQPDDWAQRFEDWLQDAIEENHADWLVTPEQLPPEFSRAHPTVEHYAPLLTAWGATGAKRPGNRIYNGFMHGNLGLSMYRFE